MWSLIPKSVFKYYTEINRKYVLAIIIAVMQTNPTVFTRATLC